MRKPYKKIKKYFSKNYELLVASVLFVIAISSSLKFQTIIIVMLEFIVIMEVVKMISDFIKQEKLKLIFVIDIFIIFLIREVIIHSSLNVKDYKDYIGTAFLLSIILVFFIFRILAIKIQPKDEVNVYRRRKKNKNIDKIKENMQDSKSTKDIQDISSIVDKEKNGKEKHTNS